MKMRQHPPHPYILDMLLLLSRFRGVSQLHLLMTNSQFGDNSGQAIHSRYKALLYTELKFHLPQQPCLRLLFVEPRLTPSHLGVCNFK